MDSAGEKVSWRIDRPMSAGRLLVHVPHASIRIPSAERAAILLDDDELARELAVMTDWHTDRIAAQAAAQSGSRVTVFTNTLSRLVVDPERFPDESEVMLAVGMGAVYSRTSTGARLRIDDPAERDRLIADVFVPYADAFAAEVDRILDCEGLCTVIDVHSYAKEPLPYELDQDALRPGVCIGTDPFHTPSNVVDAVRAAFSEIGASLLLNTPFQGTYVPTRHFHIDKRVRSVMVEIRRDLYLDDNQDADEQAVREIASRLANLFDRLADPRP
ncbi:MAG: N-formylglutamate amidohydrolase [Ilumatobacteraceae bacterium]